MLISGPGWAGKSVALLGGIMVRGNLVQIMDEKHTHASIHKRLFIQPEAPPTTTLLRLCIHVRYVGVDEVQSLLHMYLYDVFFLILTKPHTDQITVFDEENKLFKTHLP